MAQDTVQQIKERLTIQDIVGPYVKLRRAGRSLVGLCPFHKEKTGSFHVSAERGTWHCFGCGEGGDGFSFIEKVEGVDFKGALKILAEKAGVPLVYSGGKSVEEQSRQDRLRALLARAAEWFVSKLPGTQARAYASERGLKNETVTSWRVGYAPEGWRVLLEAMAAEGYSTAELLAAGLIKEAEGKPGTYYDRFRNRLIFPIRDAAGRTVGFTGRILPSEAAKEGEVAKYLNSPETELYHKSELLFGLDLAKEAVRLRKFAMLVEGQMDVIHAHQAGFENAVALSGTALTERHLALLKRYSENLMLVLDADPAGLKATARSAELALRHGLRVKAVSLPAGKDPADLASEAPQEFARRIKEAKPVVEFFLAELALAEPDPHRLLRLAESIVLPLLAAVGSPMEREHFIQSTARTLGLSTEAVRESLARVKVEPVEAKQGVAPRGTTSEPSRAATRAAEVRGGQLLAALHAYPDTPLAERIKSEYCRITGARELPATSPESALFQAEQQFGENPGESAGDELLHAFEEAVIREAYQEAIRDLRKAEASGDAAVVALTQDRCAKLSVQLAALGA